MVGTSNSIFPDVYICGLIHDDLSFVVISTFSCIANDFLHPFLFESIRSMLCGIIYIVNLDILMLVTVYLFC